MANRTHPNHDQTPDFDYSEFDYKDSDDLTHKRRLRKLLEDKMATRKLKEVCRDEWDEDDDEFEWEKLDV